MTEPLLTISAFARAVELAPSTLRYYDEAGLLPPTEVDGRTGYRYYTPDLERRAHMIRRMREVGVSVETMRLVLDGPPERAAELLNGIAERANEAARRTTEAVTDVIAALRPEGDTPGTVAVTANGPELAAALVRISRAASDQADSPLACVLLDLHDGALTVVATDRYWLATWALVVDGGPPTARRVVVPLSDVDPFADWLRRQDAVTVSVTGQDLRIVGDAEDHRVEALPDRFPAYRLLLESESDTRGRVTVDRDALLGAVGDQQDVLLVRIGGDRMSVQPQGAAEGVRLPATTSGEPIALGFSPSLLRSALTAVVGEQATLSYVAEDRAVRLTSPEQPSFVALVMPFKLDSTR